MDKKTKISDFKAPWYRVSEFHNGLEYRYFTQDPDEAKEFHDNLIRLKKASEAKAVKKTQHHQQQLEECDSI